MRGAIVGIPLALLLAVAVNGCASMGGNDVDEPVNTPNAMTLEEAKTFVIDVQSQLADYIPQDAVAERRDITKAHLMRCGDGEYKWPGGVEISLAEPIDQEAVLEAIRAAFDREPEWTVKPLDRINGYELRHENTSGFFAEFFEGANAFTVVAFSPCFPFDPELGGRY